MAAAMRRAASGAAVAATSAAGRVMAGSRGHITRVIIRSRGAFERRGWPSRYSCERLLAPLCVTWRAALQVASLKACVCVICGEGGTDTEAASVCRRELTQTLLTLKLLTLDALTLKLLTH
jgi:hypothetical protein